MFNFILESWTGNVSVFLWFSSKFFIFHFSFSDLWPLTNLTYGHRQKLSLHWLHNTKCPSETQRKVQKLKIKRERQINHEGVVWTCQPRVAWPCFFLCYSLTSRWDYLSSTANYTKQCYNFTKCEKFPRQITIFENYLSYTTMHTSRAKISKFSFIF